MPMKTVIFTLWVSANIVSAQNDIIIDNPQATFDGRWEVAKSAKDHYGDDYRSAFCVAGAPTATATYQPEIGVAGKYNIEIMYSRGDNRSQSAPWEIGYLGGTFKTKVNQTAEGGKWIRIATGLDFDVGKKGYARLLNNSGEDKETAVGKPVVIADAVRFVRTGKSSTPSTTTSTPVPAPEKTSKTSTSKKPSPPPATITVGTASTPATPPASAPGWRFSMQTSVTGNGKVVKSPDQPGYFDRDVIELTAVPDKGNIFVGWSGDGAGLDNPLKFTISNNSVVTAEFLPEALGAIIDSTEAELSGRWATNSQKWAGQRCDSYAFAPASPDGDSVAMFRPSLPKGGKYDVYIYYLQGDNRATKTVWEVSGRDGAYNVVVDQRQNGRQWFQIAAAKPFDAGSAGYVRITSKAEPIPSVVVADSVAFVYTGPLDTP